MYFDEVTHYHAQRMVTIPGYDEASNAPIRNLRAYIGLVEWQAAINIVQIAQLTSITGRKMLGRNCDESKT
jgi:hypothetical protein